MSLKMFQPNQKSLPPKLPLSSISHVIGIAAGKGGVGKSSVTVNLALALKRAGYSVGVMDTDIYGPSIRRMLPEDEIPSKKGELIKPALCLGIKMISISYFRRENEAVAVRAPIANGMISQFIKNVDWGPLDFLLIDFPPGTGDIQITLSQQANLSGAIMVTTPQEVALMDVRKAVNLFEQVNVPIIGIIENMSYYHHLPSDEKIYLFGKGGGMRLANETGSPFLGQIPIDPEICRCGDEGISLFGNLPSTSLTAQAFDGLGQAVVAHVTAMKRQITHALSSFEINWKEMS